MATITNLTSGIEVNYGGAVTYIKHGNVKLLKRGTNLNIYDDSDDDGNQRGQVYMSIPFSEVTSPVEADIDALYATVRGYIDVSSGGGGATQLNDLTDVTTGLPGTPTEADSGKILYYDFDAGVWQTDDAITAGTNVINGKKASAGTITKGKPVYLVGFDADLHTVEEANAGSSSTMPVIGFAAEDLDNTNSKHIITFGKLTGVNTSIYSVGDILYMDTSTGALTTTRPTGGNSLIQRIAKVLKVDATGGQIFVFNTARTAGLPNLGTNKLWIGDANGIPQEVDKSTLGGLTTTTLSGATILNTTYDVVLCGGGTSYTVTLPAALSNPNKSYYIKNLNPNGDDIIIDGAGYNIDGSPTFRLDPYNHSVRIISDGTHWRVLNEFGNLSKDTSFTQVNRDGTIFTWNDVTNPTTGRVWMDRNLGATQVATSSTDSLAYGDLYQWGRLKDGHEYRNSSLSSILSKDNSPLHGDFITSSNDWRSPKNDNLWQGLNGKNNICPTGYRLPTEAEWEAERLSWSSNNAAGAFGSALKLPIAGSRRSTDGSLIDVGAFGRYWSSTVSDANARYLAFSSSNASLNANSRAYGFSVRLIKD